MPKEKRKKKKGMQVWLTTGTSLLASNQQVDYLYTN
jgi:hypothetical protein